jgi:thiamine pyrophosphokinase
MSRKTIQIKEKEKEIRRKIVKAVILAGKKNSIKLIKKIFNSFSNYFFLSVDGATNSLIKTELIPDLILGDMDSINAKTLKKFNSVKKIKYLKKKNKTDLELALDYCKKFKEIILIIEYSDRLDHFLSAIELIKSRKQKIKVINELNEAEIINSKEIIELNEKKIKMNEKKSKVNEKKFYSILSVSNKSKIKLTGFKYSGIIELIKGSSLGISNELKSKKASIEVINGKILLIKSKEK